MDSLGDYLSDFERMKKFKPAEPIPEPKEETKVEAPIEVKEIIEPDAPASMPKQEEEEVENSFQQRAFKYIKILDDSLRVANYEEDELLKEQNRALTQFENVCKQMKPEQA